MIEEVSSTVLETVRTKLRRVSAEDAQARLDYVLRNRERLAQWEPAYDGDFATLAGQRAYLSRCVADDRSGRSVSLFAFDRARGDGYVVACINLTNIVRGIFQAAYLGYSVDGAYEGRGYMREAVGAAVDYAFEGLRLHRVMANYRPENERSARLLERLGFEREGYARAYLFIDGRWCDHVLTARVNPAPGG